VKVFVSFGADAADVAQRLTAELAVHDLELVAVNPSDGIRGPQTVHRAVAEADAVVFVVDEGSVRDTRLQMEWRVAVDQSWSRPDLVLIGVLVGDVEPPSFLRDRVTVRLSDGDGSASGVREILARLSGATSDEAARPEQAAQSRSALREMRLGEIGEAAAKLQPTVADFQERADWLGREIVRLASDKAGSLALARRQLELSDALKALGSPQPALEQLLSALAILEAQRSAKRLLARAHMNAGRLLQELGKLEESIPHWRKARDIYRKIDGVNSANARVASLTLAELFEARGEQSAAQAERKALARAAKRSGKSAISS
jgi:hypothetical protein